MASTRALNNDEVVAEMRKMLSFIKQEALEKAREIKVKADEEHNIEKAKVVRQETIALDAQFQRKIKQADVQKKIAFSNHVNKSRLKILQARQESVAALLVEARKKLAVIASDRTKYNKILQGLILQGLFRLMDSEVLLQCKKGDEEAVKSVLESAKSEFKKETKIAANITIETSLPETTTGGVVMSCSNGRIRCANTLESRLDLLGEQMLPMIRDKLFPGTSSRKFFD